MTGPGNEVLQIDGPLTMATVGAWLERGCVKARTADLLVDFSAVTEADSAALALLFAWLRVARKAGRELHQTGMPIGLRSLAELYGVEDLMPAEV